MINSRESQRSGTNRSYGWIEEKRVSIPSMIILFSSFMSLIFVFFLFLCFSRYFSHIFMIFSKNINAMKIIENFSCNIVVKNHLPEEMSQYFWWNLNIMDNKLLKCMITIIIIIIIIIWIIDTWKNTRSDNTALLIAPAF